MAKSKPKSRVVHRSAVTGRFITKRKADRNPRESVKERIKKQSLTKSNALFGNFKQGKQKNL